MLYRIKIQYIKGEMTFEINEDMFHGDSLPPCPRSSMTLF